jgi:hypothetical protein
MSHIPPFLENNSTERKRDRSIIAREVGKEKLCMSMENF